MEVRQKMSRRSRGRATIARFVSLSPLAFARHAMSRRLLAGWRAWSFAQYA